MCTQPSPCILVLLLFAASLPAQTGLWSKVSSQGTFHEDPVDLRPAQVGAIKRILKSRSQRDPWQSCVDDSSWIDTVKFSAVALSPVHRTILIAAGIGCARGGQGANGAMWLVELEGAHVKLLASPKQDFSGWPYSVQPRESHGFRDIVVGWHMSGFESGLTYFRFDGRSYRSIGSASLLYDNGDTKIVPGGQTPSGH